mmetsp:Transcript_16165/g.35013  ORF Transcript_16165/g.35013 Transcript_16165/m.35013 type:complete len:351 (-) Transcript_16165:649-1701(-)
MRHNVPTASVCTCCIRNLGEMMSAVEAMKSAVSTLWTLSTLCRVACSSSALAAAVVAGPALTAAATMTPARKAPSSSLRPALPHSQAPLKQKPTRTSWHSSREPCRLRIRSRCESTVRASSSEAPPTTTSLNSTLRIMTRMRAFTSAASSGLASVMRGGVGLKTGMRANSRPTVQSCRMRVPTVMLPYEVFILLVTSRHLTTTLVEDMLSRAPVNTPCITGASHTQAAMAPPRIMAIRICADPPMMVTPSTDLIFDRLSSMPRPNSSSETPSWAMVSTCTSSLTSCRPPGPTRAPAMRYPLMVGCRSASNIIPKTAAAVMTTVRSVISCGSSIRDATSELGFDRTNSLSC